MDTNEHELLHGGLAFEIVGAAMEVHNTLGSGFLEKVYHNAMVIALRKRGLYCDARVPIQVRFMDEVVGEYYADILVEQKIIVELKTVDVLTDIHKAQAINYLRATGLRLAILINFARPKLEWRRIVV